MNDEGKAVGISYVDTTTLQEYQVNGKVIILAASTCESARLLLNSNLPATQMDWPIQVVWLENTYMTQLALLLPVLWRK